jgi:lipopolysaccharide/colanic/teichoic acid biosynthesis glycosyltransferase
MTAERNVAVVDTAPLIDRYAAEALQFQPRPLDALLRVIDVLLSATALLGAAPVLALCALAVRMSGRSVLYRGARVGRFGGTFTMYKFRTLKLGADQRLGSRLGEELTRLTEAELTRVGVHLRRHKLDELPQLWNVLMGDMSLVGPRPIRPAFFEELCRDIPAYWQRLVVRPGVTGFAQLRLTREMTWEEKLAHDFEWIADRSVALYFSILAETSWLLVTRPPRGPVGRI